MLDLYIPDSVLARQRQAEAEYTEKASYGPEFGDSMVLGPSGLLSAALRATSGEGRYGDKALYWMCYKRHPFVYSCVELICQTAAQDRHTYPTSDTPGQQSENAKVKPGGSKSSQKEKKQSADNGVYGNRDTREDDGDEGDFGPHGTEPEDGIEFLEKFFAEVNEFESFPDLLESIYRDVLIFGEAFILKQRVGATVKPGSVFMENASGLGADGDRTTTYSGNGRITHVASSPEAAITSLHRIPSLMTFAIPGVDGYPASYRQKAEGGGYREYAVEDVIYFRLPDATNPCKGLSPLEALDLPVATDLSAAKYNEAYFRNGAKAGMVLSMQGVSEHEVRRNREWIANEYTKPDNAHRPMVLLGNIELVRDGNEAQHDMQFIDLRRFTREEICAVYSVPISKLLHSSDGTGGGSSGKTADDMTFRADCVGPLQSKVYSTINRQLMKREYPTCPLLIPPRQEKVRLDLLEAAKSLVQVGGTGNEARAILHLPEIDDDEMEKPLFLTPGLRTLEPDDPTPGLNQQQKTGQAGGGSQTQRPDKTSQRTSAGQKNARQKAGRGMHVRKSESLDGLTGPVV